MPITPSLIVWSSPNTLSVSLPLVRPVLQKVYRGVFPPSLNRDRRDSESYPGWVHIEWLRKITSVSSSGIRTGRTATTATTRVTGGTRHDTTNDEVELARYQGLDSFADAMTRTHTYATGEHVHWERSTSDLRNDLRVPWHLPPRSPVPGFESILEIVSPKDAGNFNRSRTGSPE